MEFLFAAGPKENGRDGHLQRRLGVEYDRRWLRMDRNGTGPRSDQRTGRTTRSQVDKRDWREGPYPR